MKYLQNNKIPKDWYKFITREEFNRHKNDMTAFGGFVAQCYSFGNNGRDYLFNPKTEKLKHLMHDVVVYQDKPAFNKLQELLKVHLTFPEGNLRDRKLNLRQQMMSIYNDEAHGLLQQLERLIITNKSYDEVEINTPYDETIVYLDPPYRNTGKYKNHIDFDKLDNFARNIKYTCFMSEYNAPFQEIFSIKKRVTMDAQDNRLYKQEKLYLTNK